MESKRAGSIRSINARANRIDSWSRPACIESAPQQPCPRGTITSQPSLERTRRVASFTSGKKARCTHPAISQVSVVGIPDRKYGEEVCAWISLKEGAATTEEEIRDFCKGQIATYKIPRLIRFTREFPMTASGKIQKFRLRELTIIHDS